MLADVATKTATAMRRCQVTRKSLLIADLLQSGSEAGALERAFSMQAVAARASSRKIQILSSPATYVVELATCFCGVLWRGLCVPLVPLRRRGWPVATHAAAACVRRAVSALPRLPRAPLPVCVAWLLPQDTVPRAVGRCWHVTLWGRQRPQCLPVASAPAGTSPRRRW